MKTKLTSRQIAARKGVRTRAANAAGIKRWLEVDKPAHEQTVALVNASIEKGTVVRVRFVPFPGGPSLMLKSTGLGTLVKVLGTGLLWRAKIDGYKSKPREWHAKFWEVV